MFLFKKNVDKSFLYAGMAIPKDIQKESADLLGISLEKGKTLHIKIVIENDEFDATIGNYKTNRDMMQIHYGAKSLLANRLRGIFHFSDEQLRESGELPNKSDEYAGVYAIDGKMYFECVPHNEITEELTKSKLIQELTFENLFDMEDPTAHYEYKESISKIRKISSDIGKKLKELYDYRCQICGQTIGDSYGAKIAHIHHIDYFSRSMNNNADNIIVVCPNHHAIIHDQDPIFDKRLKTFIFPNGYVETIKLNKHLK